MVKLLRQSVTIIWSLLVAVVAGGRAAYLYQLQASASDVLVFPMFYAVRGIWLPALTALFALLAIVRIDFLWGVVACYAIGTVLFFIFGPKNLSTAYTIGVSMIDIAPIVITYFVIAWNKHAKQRVIPDQAGTFS